MTKTKIAVLVSGGGTNLQALIDAQKSGVIESGEIVLVLSSRAGVYALERAANANIDAFAVERKSAPIRQPMKQLLWKNSPNTVWR